MSDVDLYGNRRGSCQLCENAEDNCPAYICTPLATCGYCGCPALKHKKLCSAKPAQLPVAVPPTVVPSLPIPSVPLPVAPSLPIPSVPPSIQSVPIPSVLPPALPPPMLAVSPRPAPLMLPKIQSIVLNKESENVPEPVPLPCVPLPIFYHQCVIEYLNGHVIYKTVAGVLMRQLKSFYKDKLPLDIRERIIFMHAVEKTFYNKYPNCAAWNGPIETGYEKKPFKPFFKRLWKKLRDERYGSSASAKARRQHFMAHRKRLLEGGATSSSSSVVTVEFQGPAPPEEPSSDKTDFTIVQEQTDEEEGSVIDFEELFESSVFEDGMIQQINETPSECQVGAACAVPSLPKFNNRVLQFLQGQVTLPSLRAAFEAELSVYCRDNRPESMGERKSFFGQLGYLLFSTYPNCPVWSLKEKRPWAPFIKAFTARLRSRRYEHSKKGRLMRAKHRITLTNGSQNCSDSSTTNDFEILMNDVKTMLSSEQIDQKLDFGMDADIKYEMN